MKALVILTLASATTLAAAFGMQQRTAAGPGEWQHYHRDLAGTRYSPLDQIDRSNVARLAPAWSWTADSSFGAREGRSENTPLMVNGTLYFTAGVNRSVVAADPATGRTRWVWSMDEGARLRVAPRRNSGRGVSYWRNPTGGDDRIFIVTPGFHLVALNARTGAQIEEFGTGGIVDLKTQLGIELDVNEAAIGSSSPPLVFENFVVVGPALELGTAPRSMQNVPGRIVAVNAVTGELAWRFNTIPTPGETGIESWENESWSYTGNTGAWAPMSLDEARGYLYVPVEAATGDYYGGHRHGDNLFSSTLVCLDVRTGKRIWHYQLVRHDIWDYDIPTAPVLVDINVNGRRIEAVAQMTKQAFTYVFDRVTGHPVWPIEDRPVPQSDVPGEKTAATQPFPTRPPPFDRQGVSVDDLIDFTPELRAAAVEILAQYRTGPLYTPPSLPNPATGIRGTMSLPNSLGGANWEHGAYDPETGILYVGSWTSPSVLALREGAPRSDMTYIGALGSAPNVQGLPLIKPPWNRITALDLNSGDLRWQVPAGDTPERIRTSPALQGLTIPRTGAPTRPVILATRTLLFQGEGNGGAPVMHVLDKQTGEIIFGLQLPGAVTSSPMSYMHEGRQYLAFWIADSRTSVPPTLMAFALPR